MKWTKVDLPPGDYINQQRPLIELLFERIIPLGVSQQILTSTHLESCLDHIYTNNADKLFHVSAQRNGGSDHKLVHAIRCSESVDKNIRYVTKRCYKNFDSEAFKLAIRHVSWFDVYMCEDVNLATELFTRKLTEVLDSFAPVRTIQLRKNYVPWLKENTKQLMEQRNLAQQIAISTKNPERQREYKNLRNRVTNMIRSDKRSWEVTKLDNLANSPSNLRRNIKGILNWKSSGPPNQLFYKGKIVNKPGDIASCMNEFFIDKIKNLQNRLPSNLGDPLEYARQLMSSRTSILTLKPVYPEEVGKIVRSLNNSNSTGLDNIDIGILKLILEDILPSLTRIINLSLNSSTFPDSWKKAKVIPLLKKGDPLDPKNYRPVALLSVMSKVLEKVIFMQVMDYLENHAILHPSHHGSRPKHSTCTAIIEMHSSWIEAIENGDMAAVMMLDLSAAFDLVTHDLLLQKLELMGFDETAVAWFNSYLRSRSQCVYIDGKLSELLEVSVGVPQGSVLGALIYILFVNELPTVINEDASEKESNQVRHQQNNHTRQEMLCCYVDDSTVTVSSNDPDELSSKLSSLYKRLATFFGNNKLVINNEKTHLVVMGSSKYAILRNQVTIDTGSVTIKPVETEKLLGLNIHQSLKWKEHLVVGNKSLLMSLTRRLNGLKRVTTNASFKTRLLIANACFLSIMSYMITIWGGSEGYLLKMVQVIQNRAARVVTRLTWYTPTRVLLKQCNWLSVKQMIFMHTCVQIWKLVIYRTPQNIYSQLKPAGTRSGDYGTLSIRATDTAIGRNSFMVRGLLAWNRVPNEIRQIQNLHTFKKKLRVWVRLNIDIE